MQPANTTQDDLSFVVGKDYWVTRPSGRWGEDNAVGRQYARELVAYMSEHQRPHLLFFIAQRIIDRGHAGGIECGFFTELAAATMGMTIGGSDDC